MKKYSIFYLSLCFFIIDQVLKVIFENNMILNHSNSLIKNFFNITLVHNSGAAFSILSGNRLLLIIIGCIALICILYYIRKISELSKLDLIIYSLLIGGIIGNLYDRIIFGYVIDYLDFNLGFYNFPIFNFADICIVLSILLMVYETFKEDLWSLK